MAKQKTWFVTEIKKTGDRTWRPDCIHLSRKDAKEDMLRWSRIAPGYDARISKYARVDNG